MKFFLNSFNKLRMRGECNYWQSIADRSPDNVRACFGLDDNEIEELLHMEGDDDDPSIEKDVHNKTHTMKSIPVGASLLSDMRPWDGPIENYKTLATSRQNRSCHHQQLPV